jgi:tetratricopeptide (TPR) repeat protein
VLVDGSAPPGNSTAIESECNGTSRIEGYTDSRGRFSVRLGERSADVTPDASVGAGPGIARPFSPAPSGGNALGGRPRLDDCELRARLPGYESETITLAGRVSDQTDIGVIFLHRLGPAEGLMVSVTSLAAPKDAQKALREGREALAKGKRDEARKSLEKATSLYPKYALAWFELGALQLVQGDPRAARASFEAAIRAEARFLPPYVALAVLQAAAQEWPQLEETTARAIALDPYGAPRMYFYSALAKYSQHNVDGAEKDVREAERLDKKRDIVGAWELLGSILTARRDFAGAAEQFRTYLALAPQAANATEIRARLDHMERLSARIPAGGATR